MGVMLGKRGGTVVEYEWEMMCVRGTGGGRKA